VFHAVSSAIDLLLNSICKPIETCEQDSKTAFRKQPRPLHGT